ncbi:hypothetical protein [Paradevosia shaoguanensis]|jgi:hypothetical protein|uniref:DUF3299 domain-containing protein n=1 Tax=Paradevosia shaoguanensis TaxID=1335043 RepID=A0AA41QQE6_9HYPH|nr:hypothetical protein [Paradevosia shaoguanensis]KFL28804.1 hypothetical protein JP74_00035 [Devosia sp. 17-2-E-8]QMV00918.1 hypothetical protein GHV40_05205 [Devosia sp. D6-9]CDP52474.1 hypothetical protein [Devosia sp. DBB001]MCF1744297.1 hypothetical protein [Paradevosia shaoguanensis]MCI0128780.1 hypothetical protein [Paradevosia shaoguanensis]
MITRRTFGAGLVGLSALPLLSTPSRAETPRIRMGMLYDYDKDMAFSDTANELAGSVVEIQGFMAPHLKVDSDFFILSNQPVDTCPFCESEDAWIDTIIFVVMRERQEAINPGTLIWTRGTLDIGPAVDEATGFVSRVRLLDADFYRA